MFSRSRRGDTQPGRSTLTLHLDAKRVAEARSLVGRRELNDYIDFALRRQLQHDRLRQLLAEWEAESGPIPDEMVNEALQLWYPEEFVTRVQEVRSSSTREQ